MDITGKLQARRSIARPTVRPRALLCRDVTVDSNRFNDRIINTDSSFGTFLVPFGLVTLRTSDRNH